MLSRREQSNVRRAILEAELFNKDIILACKTEHSAREIMKYAAQVAKQYHSNLSRYNLTFKSG